MLDTTETIASGSIAKLLNDLRIKHGHTAKACLRTMDSLSSDTAITLAKDIATTHRQHLDELDSKIAEYSLENLDKGRPSRSLKKFGEPLMLVRSEHSLLDELLTKEQLLALEYEHALNPIAGENGIEPLLDTHFRELIGVCEALKAYVLETDPAA